MGSLDEVRKTRPEDEDDQRLWVTKTAILSPGDRVEYKLVVKKGDSLYAAAQSDAFDPALTVENEKGKVLAKNDDREEGDQSPFIAFHFPEAGTYKLKVLSYGSKSGGSFTVKIRTFEAIDAKTAVELHAMPPRAEGDVFRTVFRIQAKKGKIYDLREAIGTKPGPSYPSFRRVVGPTGVDANDYRPIQTPDGKMVFEALVDGDYYAEYDGDRSTEVRTDFREVAVVQAKPTDELALEFAPGELKIIEMSVKPDLIVRTTLVGGGLLQSVNAPANPRGSFAQQGDLLFGNTPAWTWFRLKRDRDDDLVRVFHGTGKAQFVIRSTAADAQRASLKNVESLPLWTDGQSMTDRLGIGESRLYLLTGSVAELMTIAAQATQFELKLDIIRLNGVVAESLLNRQTHSVRDDLYFPTEDRYVVRITCEGFGGSGEYTMKRDTALATAIAIGASGTVTLNGTNFGLFSVDLVAGKRYQLVIDHPDVPLDVVLLDETGQSISGPRINFEQVSVQYFVPVRSGKHRLWLRGGGGQWHFKLEPSTPPTVGG
jgi:hypothetical protein